MQELKTVQEILKNNHYYQQIIDPKQKHNLSTNSQGIQKSEWATFTYYDPDLRTLITTIQEHRHKNSIQNY
jgi:hypothetical protein